MNVSSPYLAVIVGAGKTGRGFLARLIAQSGYGIVFVDRNPELVDRISQMKEYGIHFFGDSREPFQVSGVSAVLAGSNEAIDFMAQADIVLTAIGETNLPSLTGDVLEVINRRKSAGFRKLRLLVGENGTSPSARLRNELKSEEDIEIGEAAIFCSTVEKPGTVLDILSEPYDELPYDLSKFTVEPLITGARAIPDFPKLLKRKIFTYNCLSACVAYLGAYKGYKWLSEAANDHDVDFVVGRVAASLNGVLANYFQISIEEQTSFFGMAVSKFKDRNILDDVVRNAQSVIRKLGPTDRLMGPLSQISESGGDVAPLALVVAAGLCYGESAESDLREILVGNTLQKALNKITGIDAGSVLSETVVGFYNTLKSSASLELKSVLCGA